MACVGARSMRACTQHHIAIRVMTVFGSVPQSACGSWHCMASMQLATLPLRSSTCWPQRSTTLAACLCYEEVLCALSAKASTK